MAEINCGREKYWDECTPEEKIGRLKEEVLRLMRQLDEWEKVQVKLLSHSHTEHGSLVAPLACSGEQGSRTPWRLLAEEEKKRF